MWVSSLYKQLVADIDIITFKFSNAFATREINSKSEEDVGKEKGLYFSVLVGSFYSPCKSVIYVDSARGIYRVSTSMSLSVALQKWLTTDHSLESFFWKRKNEKIMKS